MAKIYTLATALLTFALASYAAIPVRWTTDAYKVKPLVYECYHGETLDLAAALTAYGEPLDFAGKTARLYWQTNGMESAWWSTNAFVRAEAGATNILAAIWSGAYDAGAASVTGFIGVEGENYRAAFQLNFRPSPGFSPSALPIPPKAIDWASVANANVESAPFVVKGGAGGVTLQQVTNVANDRIDAKVADWAMRPNPPPSGMTTNQVSNLITNHVTSGYLCTSNAAVALAGAAEARAKAEAADMTNAITFAQLKNKPMTLSGYGITDAVRNKPNNQQSSKLGWNETSYYPLLELHGELSISEYGVVAGGSGTFGGRIFTAEYVQTPTIKGYEGTSIEFDVDGTQSNLAPDGSDVLTKNLGDGYYLGINGQIQSDWNQTNTSAKDYIKNKPTIITATTATNIAQSVLKNAVENEYVGISIMTNFLPITGGGYDWSSYRFDDAKTKYGAFRFLLIPKGSSEPAAVFDASGAYVSGSPQVRFNSSPATFGVKMLNVVEGKVALTTDIQDVAAPIATNIVKDATNSLATVAHSGDYDDLSGRPNIPVISTNAAEAVVGDHLYYASTNLADNVELRLFSGEWVNAEYDGVGTADVVLDLTGVPTDKVTDTLMVLNCAATGTLNVATSVNACRVIHKKDAKVHELKAGINLLTFSRFRMENGTNFVLVTNNELE